MYLSSGVSGEVGRGEGGFVGVERHGGLDTVSGGSLRFGRGADWRLARGVLDIQGELVK